MATSDSGLSKESPSNNPGLNTKPDEPSKGYIMQQTMFRIKDPKASLKISSQVLGMSMYIYFEFFYGGLSGYLARKSLQNKKIDFVIERKNKGNSIHKDPDGYWIEIFDTKSIKEVVVDAA